MKTSIPLKIQNKNENVTYIETLVYNCRDAESVGHHYTLWLRALVCDPGNIVL